ncbi:hypothetical protein C9F11_21260 [Streptomyces sp. YIM 121038]|nr:hypothetical protein C9F11_21260 [Streptomyces sp. YIM 121038]
MYVWGVCQLALMDDKDKVQACKDAVGRARAAEVDRYEPSYVPLRLGCHVAKGDTYAAGVPSYVNPAALGLALAGAALAVSSALAPEYRVKESSIKESPR